MEVFVFVYVLCGNIDMVVVNEPNLPAIVLYDYQLHDAHIKKYLNTLLNEGAEVKIHEETRGLCI